VTDQSDQVNLAGDPVKTPSDTVNVASTANRTIGIAIAAIVLVFGIFTVALGRAGFFTFTGTDPSSKVVAQALTFVGGLVGAVVSILGILLKYSIDRQAEARLAVDSRRSAALQDRAERRLQMDSDRSAAMQQEAEKRLKLDSDRSAAMQQEAEKRLRLDSDRSAAMQQEAEQRLTLEAATKVIQLFATSDGREAPPTQIAGGLLTLSSLGQHSLAILLTTDLLRRNKIDGSTACEVIEQALQRGSEDIQADAINVMVSYPERMLTESGMAAPTSISDWAPGLCDYVREWAPIALADIMTRRPLAEWRCDEYEGVANAVLSALALGWLHENNRRLKDDIGVILNCLLIAFPFSPGTQLYHPKKTIDVDKIRAEVAVVKSTDRHVVNMVARLNKWITDTAAAVPPNQPA
jgi:hypothetical protein